MSRHGRALAWPAPPAWAAAAAVVLLVALAPPAHPAFWAANGLRSVRPAVAAGVIAAAGLAGLLAWRPPRGRVVPIVLALAIAAVLAFALPERWHLPGDTDSRRGSISTVARGVEPQPLADWARAMHAQPLDALAGIAAPVAVARASHERADGVAWVSFALALVYLAGVARAAGRLGAGDDRVPLAAALATSGGLLAFAAYAESAGVALAAGAWWWSAMLRPLARRRDAAWLALAWIVLVASHRVAFALLPAQLVRAAFAAPGDARGPRRAALAATLASGAAALAAQRAFDGGRTAGDLAELLRGAAPGGMARVPVDLANLALLVAPLALLAAAFAGRAAWARAARDPRGWTAGVAALALLPTAFPLPVAASGLGVMRDWDLSALLGLACAVGAGLVLAHAPAPRRRGALVVALPVLVLLAGGWVAVHADARAVEARALALRDARPALGPSAQSSLLLVLAARELEAGRMAESARDYEASWALVPSPARGLHAAMAWLYARDPANARRVLAAVRARGELPPRRAAEADSLEVWIGQVEERLGAIR